MGERSYYELVLCFAKALHDNLLGGLHADAPRIGGMNFNIDCLTGLDVRLYHSSIIQGDLMPGIGERFDDGFLGENPDLPASRKYTN
ncbi:MAG: hypothetical protein DDT24_00097 [Chloroflexi bacterium]|nr:hypothetical protein [Chloroflexota bacterium]